MKADKEAFIPLRTAEWTPIRLAWEYANQSDIGRLALIAFELNWRDDNGPPSRPLRG